MKTNKTLSLRLLLLAILLIAALLRLPLLSSLPNGFGHDEAIVGYDAYSIFHTLKDQFGNFLPIFSKSFDSYDETIYRYLAILPISIFGLNEFSTRLPAAMAGILTVLVFYFLIKECFDKRLAIFASFLLAINPWHIHASRIAFREILLLPLFCLALLLFVKGLKRSGYLVMSAAVFGLTLYTYSAARVFVPLFFLCLIGAYWRELLEKKKSVLLISAVSFLIIFLPLFYFWISPQGMMRAHSVLHLRPYLLLIHYLSYFDTGFLFTNWLCISNFDSIPDVGKLYVFELLTVGVGAYYFFTGRSQYRKMFGLWLLLYPIPAAFTAGAHTRRALIGAPILVFLSAYGCVWLIDRLKSKVFLGYAVFLAVTLASVLWFTRAYFIKYRVHETDSWKYGMQEAIGFAEQSSSHKVYVSNRFQGFHGFVLFYTQYPPASYQKAPIDISTKSYLKHPEYIIGKYHVTSLTPENICSKSLSSPNNMWMMYASEFSGLNKEVRCELRTVKEIRNPLGKSVIKFVEVAD